MNPEHTIYVVSFCPADDQGGMGGHTWHPDKDTATMAYLHEVKESHRAGNGYIVRLVEMTTKHDPATTPSQVITDELEHRSDEHEVTTPALRQYIPANTHHDHIPTGGTARNPNPATMTIEQITGVFWDMLNYDTLHDSIAEDIDDTRLDKGDGPSVGDMPGMGFHYVLDTNHYTMPELAHLAAHYRQKIDTLNALMENVPEVTAEWRTWDILEYITGSDNLVAPPGVTVVTHDTINSYAYPTISEYAQNNPVHTIT